MAAFTVKYIPKGTREISPSLIVTKGSIEIIVTLHPLIPPITKFEIIRDAGVIKTYNGTFEPGKSYKFQDLTPEIGTSYTYQVQAHLPFPPSPISSPAVTIIIPCSTVCCPQRFKYGRWNNTSTKIIDNK